MMQYIGLIGYPLNHSISPAFQQAAIDYYQLDMRYQLWETNSSDLAMTIQRLRSPDYCGANVTIPHKEAVAAFLDDIDETAREVGAINTIVSRNGKLTGYNTDVQGFMKALKEDAGFETEKKHAVVLGAGGAARAVCYGLIQSGIAVLTIMNRSFPRAQSLVSSLAQHALANRIGIRISAAPWADEPSSEIMKSCHLIVNCTSIGMRHTTTEHESPVPAAALSKDVLIYDLVYNPQETPLIKAAKAAKARTLGGLSMLVYQGGAAFELWTGRKAPLQIMMQAAKRALED